MIKLGYIFEGYTPLESPRRGAIHMRNFLEHFIKLGNEAFFIRKHGRDTSDTNATNDITMYNIRWVDGTALLPGSSLVSELLFNFKLYQAGSAILKKEKPDIIHERELFLKCGGLYLAKKFKIPYILEVNAPLLLEIGRGYSRIHQKLGGIIEQKLFNEADRIIVVSNILKRFLEEQGVPEDKICVILNGVDETVFNPSVSGETVRQYYELEDREVVCFAGSLDQDWQGIDDLLEAARLLAPLKPSVNFLIVGDTERRKAIRESAPDNVIFTGQIAHENMPFYLAAADILVAPYKHQLASNSVGFYNSPLKLFEYLAMGKPIITSNLGQIAEIIEDGKTGLLVEPGDYQHLVEDILLLLDDDRLRTRLGEHARTEVVKNYTWTRNAEKIIDLYKRVLE